MKRSTSIWAAAAILAAAIGLAYGRTLRDPFVFDDFASIQSNPTLHPLSVRALAPPNAAGVGGRPILNLSFALDYALGGSLPVLHATNLLIHLLAALTLFALLTERPGVDARSPPLSRSAALAAALLFALHPLQTESVTYLSERAESLMGFFYLFTVYAFLRYAREVERVAPNALRDATSLSALGATRSTLRSGVGVALCARGDSLRARARWGQRAPPWAVVSVLSCALAMATKEVAVTAPVIVFLFDAALVAGSFGAAWAARRSYYLWLAATWLILVPSLTTLSSRSVGLDQGVTAARYALEEIHAVAGYLRLIVWPFPQVFDYGQRLIGSHASLIGDAALLTAIALILIWAWWSALPSTRSRLDSAGRAGTPSRPRRSLEERAEDASSQRLESIGRSGRDGVPALPAAALRVGGNALHLRVIAFLGTAFFLLLVPTSSVIAIAGQPMAEHRLYLPIAVAAAAVAALLGSCFARSGAIALFLLAAACAFATGRRNEVYRSETDLWADTAAKAPHNERAQVAWGLARNRVGDYAGAAEHFRAALALHPPYPYALLDLGDALLSLNRPAEAESELRKAIALRPNLPEAHYDLGLALERQNRRNAAEREFREALAEKPDFAEAANHLMQAGYNPH